MLRYGKVRGIIDKKGPRNLLRIQTKGAVMGVRGTDFFIVDTEFGKRTNVSVVRGAVQMTPLAVKSAQAPTQAVLIEKGMTGEIQTTPVTSAPFASGPQPGKPLSTSSLPFINVRKTNRSELGTIMKVAAHLPAPTNLAPALKEKILQLESQAAQSVQKELLAEDPEALKSLAQDPTSVSLEKWNHFAVEKIYHHAPAAPTQTKPSSELLEGLEEGVYQRYFKTPTGPYDPSEEDPVRDSESDSPR